MTRFNVQIILYHIYVTQENEQSVCCGSGQIWYLEGFPKTDTTNLDIYLMFAESSMLHQFRSFMEGFEHKCDTHVRYILNVLKNYNIWQLIFHNL